jgi:nicotinamidase-related amidase
MGVTDDNRDAARHRRAAQRSITTGGRIVDPMEGLRAAMAAVDAYYKERGIFQGRFGFGQRPALIVIDMAYGWTDPAYAAGSARLDGAVAAIARLLAASRARRVPVIYTTAPFRSRPQLKSAEDFSPGFRPWDQRACDIDERLRPEAGEYIIAKEHASAFAGTALVGHLVGLGVDTLLITGCSTSACVRATATDAKSYQFRPILVREGVQDRSEIAHEWTLFDIQARFADVVDLAEALAYLDGLPVRLPTAG